MIEFMQLPTAKMLPDGCRLHLHHGPIDLIIEAFGPGKKQALMKAQTRFSRVLDELVDELQLLRQPCIKGREFHSPIANRMQNAVEYYLPDFITPMAAVAGGVADEIIKAMAAIENIDKIYVNNGGDSAFYLTRGQSLKAAIIAQFAAEICIKFSDPFRGIATSGWEGRSHSLGIADSVSVVAKNCAVADAAATMIANKVNLHGHAAISRIPASEILPDSDLGEQLVTIQVGDLTDIEIDEAFCGGVALAGRLVQDEVIGAAMIILKNQMRQIGAQKLIQTIHGEMADA